MQGKARRVCAELNSSGNWLDLTVHTRKEQRHVRTHVRTEFGAWGPKQDHPEPQDLLTMGRTQSIQSRHGKGEVGEEEEEARGCGEEDKEAAAAGFGRHPNEPGPALHQDGGAHLAIEVATQCVASPFQDFQRQI
ncbi:hypothetical protein JHK82_050258 [Glycine max]|nr:hypothetical protein JHK82_050258 [Glycine max]